MRPADRELAARISVQLEAHGQRFAGGLPGITDPANHRALVEQLVESTRRIRYVEVLRGRPLSTACSDPRQDCFDPLKAAIRARRAHDIDEALWLVFLAVHFGKHDRRGWGYARAVYGRLGEQNRWSWTQTRADPAAFRDWLDANQAELRRRGGFGNHRKYESLAARSEHGTGATIESYLRWVGARRTHRDLIEGAIEQAHGNPTDAFDALYESMDEVVRFGRTARFDYLCMAGKLGLAPIQPGSAYMVGATGPLSGARLLFTGDRKAPIRPADLDPMLVALDADLNVGMQAIEDALCNWQKCPQQFVPFRG